MPLPSLVQTLADLVRLNSVNPAYGDGGSEASVVAYLREFCQQRGLEAWEQEVFPGRSNFIVRLPGRGPGRIVLEAHTDTVSIKGMSIAPFDPVLCDGRLYGRGAVDDKAGLAAMLHAVVALHEEGIVPPCEVWLAAVVDEEFSFRGVVSLCAGLEATAAIVAEPTELRVVTASKGVLRLRLVTHGKAAHSSKPHLGNNAISHMARLVLALEEENARLARWSHPLLGPATVSVGVIHGGVQVNQVAERCAIELDRRLLPGERAEEVIEGYRALSVELGAQVPGFSAAVELPPLLADEALETPPESRVVAHAQSILRELNLPDAACGVPFGSDASKLSRAGIPTIIFGPGSIDQAHAADEFVSVRDVEIACEFYRRFILTFSPQTSSPP